MAEFRQVLRSDTRRVTLVSPLDIRYGPDDAPASLRYFLTNSEPSEGKRRTYIRQSPGSPWAVRVKVLKGGQPVHASPGKPLQALLKNALRLIPGGRGEEGSRG